MLRLLTLGLLAHSTKQLNPSVEKNELVPQSDDVIYVTTNKECYISEGNLGLFAYSGRNEHQFQSKNEQ